MNDMHNFDSDDEEHLQIENLIKEVSALVKKAENGGFSSKYQNLTFVKRRHYCTISFRNIGIIIKVRTVGHEYV